MLCRLKNQNMQSAASDTTKRKYIRNNICEICGLSFIQTDITSEVNERKSLAENDV